MPEKNRRTAFSTNALRTSTRPPRPKNTADTIRAKE